MSALTSAEKARQAQHQHQNQTQAKIPAHVDDGIFRTDVPEDNKAYDADRHARLEAQHMPDLPGVDVVEVNELSFASIIKGTAAAPMTPFEKKAALVNAYVTCSSNRLRCMLIRSELDKFGFGRYQQYIWLLCGFGYFLDLAWAQGVGLIASAIYQEMGVPDDNTGLIFTCANAGLA